MNNLQTTEKPGAVFWFHVYLVVLCFLYLAVAAGGLFLIAASQGAFGLSRSSEDSFSLMVTGIVLVPMAIVLFVACLIPFFAPRRRWVWVYGSVLICLGMSSACFLPACVVLLVYWLKPETQAWFGRN